MKMPANVLIVEDEHMLAYVLQDMVESLGVLSVSHAATLADALDLVARNEFDFAFLDINLGKENSIPVARQLGERNVPYVFASGYDSKYDAEGLTAPLLRKPIGIEEIKAALTSRRPDAGNEHIGRIG